jgi:succinate dehydrogenase / fumarate reductase cytochrome b subunit
MSATQSDPRPISPHLQVWRWHLTMLLSILHRVSGMALYAGAFLIVYWLGAAAAGPEAYAFAEGLLLSPIGRLVLFGFTLAATYHLFNGIRHLLWDVGWGLKPSTATATGWLTLLLTIAATLGVWAAAYWL